MLGLSSTAATDTLKQETKMLYFSTSSIEIEILNETLESVRSINPKKNYYSIIHDGWKRRWLLLNT